MVINHARGILYIDGLIYGYPAFAAVRRFLYISFSAHPTARPLRTASLKPFVGKPYFWRYNVILNRHGSETTYIFQILNENAYFENNSLLNITIPSLQNTYTTLP